MILNAVYEEVPESQGGGYVAYTEELCRGRFPRAKLLRKPGRI